MWWQLEEVVVDVIVDRSAGYVVVVDVDVIEHVNRHIDRHKHIWDVDDAVQR